MAFLSFARVGCASPGCADPISTMLDANTFVSDMGGAAVGNSAGYLLAVLPAMAAPLQSVGYALHLNTLAECSVFAAQASRLCFGGAVFDRALLLAMCTAEASSKIIVGASINRANLCILPTRALLLAMLAAMAAPLLRVGYAPHFNTLAFCSVFVAQASRHRFGGATFHRARLLAVCPAEASCINGVGAPTNRANLCSVFAAQASRVCFGGAACHRARLPAVVCAEPSSMNGVGAPTNRANLCILPTRPLSFLFWHPHFVQPVLCF